MVTSSTSMTTTMTHHPTVLHRKLLDPSPTTAYPARGQELLPSTRALALVLKSRSGVYHPDVHDK